MTLHDRISELIGQIYDAALNQAEMESTISSLLNILDGRWSHFGIIGAFDGPRPFAGTAGLDNLTSEDLTASFKRHNLAQRRISEFIRQHPKGGAVTSAMLYRPDEFTSSAVFAWTQKTFGTRHWSLCFASLPGGRSLGINIHRTAAQGELSPKEQQLFSMLFKHYDRAIQIGIRDVQALTGKDESRLFLDHAGRITMMDASAEAVISANDGLRVEHGYLVGGRSVDTMRLSQMVAKALGSRHTGEVADAVVIPRPSARTPYVVSASSAPRRGDVFDFLRPAAIVTIVDPSSMTLEAPQLWRKVLGLSAAEVRLMAAWLSQDADLRRAADTAGLAYETARAHMRSIFAKTEVNSQARLMQLLLAIGKRQPQPI